MNRQQIKENPFGRLSSISTKKDNLPDRARFHFFESVERFAGMPSDIKPINEVCILDAWEFLFDDERLALKETNDPVYQAWLAAKEELGIE